MFECLPVFELCKEIEQFLRHRSSGIARHSENEEFVMSLAYLADIFSHPNHLNTSIRVTTMYMITARETYLRAPTNFQSVLVAPMLIFHNLVKFPREKHPYSLSLKYKSICRCYVSPSRDTFRLQPGEISVSQG